MLSLFAYSLQEPYFSRLDQVQHLNVFGHQKEWLKVHAEGTVPFITRFLKKRMVYYKKVSKYDINQDS